MKQRLGLYLSLCLLWPLAALVHPVPSAALPPSAPLKGVFENCSLEHRDTLHVCVERLDKAKSMGFQLVLNRVSGADPAVASSYALAAQRRGLLLAWALQDPSWWTPTTDPGNVLGSYPAWAQSCGCLTNSALLGSLVMTLANLPGAWGWYIADDSSLHSGTVTAVRAWNRRLKRLAPSMKTIIGIIRPSDLDRYRGAADYLAQESYPFGRPHTRSLQRRVPSLARYTEAHTPDSAFILQAFSWGDNIWDAEGVSNCGGLSKGRCMKRLRYPTLQQMLWHKRTILRNARPRLLLWYGMHDTLGFFPPLEDPNGNYNPPSGRQVRVRGERLGRAVRSDEDDTGSSPRSRRRSRSVPKRRTVGRPESVPGPQRSPTPRKPPKSK